MRRTKSEQHLFCQQHHFMRHFLSRKNVLLKLTIAFPYLKEVHHIKVSLGSEDGLVLIILTNLASKALGEQQQHVEEDK